ncbi:hypothetical protein [Salmonella phage SD-1_S14]|nr:hypothetical protein [Salmonella phage SD-1_S14]
MTVIIIIAFLITVFFIFMLYIVAMDEPNTSFRNYEVRFSAQNNKYYIVNCIHRSEKRVTSRFGFTIYYKDRVEADMICQKLNTVEAVWLLFLLTREVTIIQIPRVIFHRTSTQFNFMKLE